MDTQKFDRTKDVQPKSNGWLTWPPREHHCMGCIHERHTSTRSSSWSRLYGEFTIYQESTPEVCETAIPTDWKVDRGSKKKSIIWPRLITKKLSGDRRLYCVTTLLRLRTPKNAFTDSVLCLRGISDQPLEAWENKIKWYLETRYLKDLLRIDGEPMELEWHFSQDSQHWVFSDLSSSKEGSSSCQCDECEWSPALRTKANGRLRPHQPCTLLCCVGMAQTFPLKVAVARAFLSVRGHHTR